MSDITFNNCMKFLKVKEEGKMEIKMCFLLTYEKLQIKDYKTNR